MWMAGTYCPYMGAIGVEAKKVGKKTRTSYQQAVVVFGKKLEQDIKDVTKNDRINRWAKVCEVCFIWHGYAFWHRGIPSFSSQAVDCSTDTVGLCTPTIEEIIDETSQKQYNMKLMVIQ